MRRVALALGLSALTSPAYGEPIADVAPHRSADGARIEASAVGLPDARFPSLDARCRSARRAAFVRARASLHAYVDDALRRAPITPPVIDAAHRALDRDASVLETRGLVDCGAVVTLAVPVASLVTALEGAEVRFP